LLFKLIAIALLMGVSLAASFSVLGLVIERSHRSDEAIREIASAWSREQTITGPVIAIPLQTTVITSTGQTTTQENNIFLLPDTLTYDISVDTETRSRGIFEAAVYTSRITGTGSFNLDDVDRTHIDGIVQWDNATVFIGIPDTRGVESSAVLLWNGEEIIFEPGVPRNSIEASGISVPLNIQPLKKEHMFSFDIILRGSEAIYIAPLGKTTDVSISSNWPAPSFTGAFLPKEHNLTDAGFTAKWNVSSFGRSLPQSWVESATGHDQTIKEHIVNSLFGVSLNHGVDFYTQVNRSVKYSVLFIALTFLVFFMFEVLSQLRVHPLNYLLIGLAIALFYLLLLSLAEHVGFLSAYSISAIAITGLITGYARSVLKAKKKAGIIAVLLSVLYSYLYILLQLDEFSLLFGSLFLFAILAIVMYLTRNIDWYGIGER